MADIRVLVPSYSTCRWPSDTNPITPLPCTGTPKQLLVTFNKPHEHAVSDRARQKPIAAGKTVGKVLLVTCGPISRRTRNITRSASNGTLRGDVRRPGEQWTKQQGRARQPG